jgi:Putative transposase, YhgA-like
LKTQEHSIHQPHAKLFETVFSDPVEAVSFFQAYLPDALTTRIVMTRLRMLILSPVSVIF